MKKLVIQKQDAMPILEFLDKVEISDRMLTRKREKLKKKLTNIAQEKEEDRVKIVKGLANKDEKGEPVLKGETYDVPAENKKELNEAVKELGEEEVAIEFGDYSANITPLMEFLDSDNFTYTFSGNDSYAYDTLMTAFEEAIEKEPRKKATKKAEEKGDD